MKSFNKTVAASGTPESVSKPQLLTNSAKIKALAGNTNKVFVGDASGQTYELSPKEEVSITEIFEKDGGSADIDLAEVFIRVTTNGEGVCVIYADRTKVLSS
jgi:hypothetical protein